LSCPFPIHRYHHAQPPPLMKGIQCPVSDIGHRF
jgi:hypothetical protein